MRRSLFALAALAGSAVAQQRVPPVDQSKLRITLQRSACFGSCPDYKVEIDGSGDVVFETAPSAVDPVSALHRRYAPSDGIVVHGTHRAHIDPTQVMALVDRARAADFFALKAEYRAAITDSPTYVVTIDTGHGKKSVVDYVGLSAGMPQAEKDLEDAIDAAAGTKRWIEGTADAIPALQREQADFAGPLGAALMNAAAARDEVPMMERLKSLGAPTNAVDGVDPLSNAASSGALNAARFLVAQSGAHDREGLRRAIESAVRTNDEAMFHFLLDAGGGASLIDGKQATRLLPSAAGNGNLAITTLLIGAGADVQGPEDRRQYDDPPLFPAAAGVFHADRVGTPADRRGVVALLLAHGAKVTRCETACKSALAFVSDPQIARMLIEAGADPNFKDSEGEAILFSIYDEDVALELIRAGARLDAIRPADKMTLRGWAVYQKWPKVLALLVR